MRALSQAQATAANQAFQLLGAGDAQGALDIARRIQAQAPDAADANHLLALSLSYAGQQQAALPYFQKALALLPRHPAIRANYARCLRQCERHDEALTELRTTVEHAPGFAEGWLALGDVALDLNQLELARSALERALKIDASGPRGWHLLGSVKRKLGDYEGSERDVRAALERAPSSPSALANLGATLRLLGRSSEALECYINARKAGGSAPEITDATVGTLTDIGEMAQALKVARSLVSQHPEFVPGHVTLAHLQWEYGSGEESLAEFRASAAAQSHNDEMQLALIGFLLGARQADEALERIVSLRQRADHPILATYQANALELLGRSAEAAPLYAAAHRQLGDRDPAFLNAYVRHLLKTGDAEQAVKLSRGAIALDPDNQEALAYLSTAWRLLGDDREFWLCNYERDIALLDVTHAVAESGGENFIAELQSTLDQLHKAHTEPVLQSLRKGSQTPGRLFGRPDPVIGVAQQALQQAIEAWLLTLPEDADHPFLRRRAKGIRFTGSWSVKLRSSGNHVNHIHPQGWISSAYYVALPPSVVAADSAQDLSGHIQFGQPPVELGLNLPPRRVIKPEVGKLALFPSYMWHGTVPFEDDHPRMTIAFDMTPRA